MFLILGRYLESIALLVVGSLIVLLGFGGDLFFRKTDVPNVLWLMLFGLLLGQVFNVLDRKLLSSFVGLFGAIAIVVILFDGGLRFEVREVVEWARRGFLLMSLGVVFSIIVTTVVMVSMGFGLSHALLMGLILCGTSSSIIIPMITKMRSVSEHTKTILSLESIADTFTVALALLTMRAMLAQTPDLSATLVSMFDGILNGFFFGLIGGLTMVLIMMKIWGEEFSYAVVLSILFLLYSLTEFVGGSGAIAVFVAGILLANREEILKPFGLTEGRFQVNAGVTWLILDTEVVKTHSLVAFFVRTFFFVYVGAIVTIDNVIGLLVGALISLGLLLVRPLFVWIVTHGVRDIRSIDRRVMTVMLPRGLSAAVLALLPHSMGIPNTETFSDIVFTVILGTTCIATIGMMTIEKPG